MRKLTVTLLSALALAGLSAGGAFAAHHARAHSAAPPALCGTLYKPPCAPPSSVISSIASCRGAGTVIKMPIRLHSNAGLKSVKVTLRGRTIKSLKFKGRPTSKTLRVSISTRGLKAGIYTVTVKVTDVRGVTRSRAAHFSICKPKPVFTG
jgi:hypothetical protein